MAESFGGAAGFGERPAVVVVDLNLGFTDPSSPLACDLDDVLVSCRTLLDAARDAGVPVFFTSIEYDEVGRPRPPCSCARCRRCRCYGRGRAGSSSIRGSGAAPASRC